jgi:hypothetical protein
MRWRGGSVNAGVGRLMIEKCWINWVNEKARQSYEDRDTSWIRTDCLDPVLVLTNHTDHSNTWTMVKWATGVYWETKKDPSCTNGKHWREMGENSRRASFAVMWRGKGCSKVRDVANNGIGGEIQQLGLSSLIRKSDWRRIKQWQSNINKMARL